MADAPTSTVDTSIYRQPAPQNPLDMLTKVGQAADSLGGIAVGQATQDAIDPTTGEIDRNQLMQALRGSVAGSMKAIPTAHALEQLRAAGFQADQQGLETFQKRMAITNHLFSGLASKGRIDPKTGQLVDGPTMSDVHDVAARALDPALNAKKYGITLPVIMNALNSFRDPVTGKELSPAQIKKKALEIQTHAATTSEILHQHSPQVRVVDDGSTVQFEPGGTVANPAVGQAYPKQLPPTTPVATPSGRQYQGPAAVPPPPPFRTSTSPNRPATFEQRFEGIPDGRAGLPAVPGAGLPGVFPRMGATPIAGAPGEPTGSPSAPRPVVAQPVVRPPTGPMESLRPGYEEAAKSVATSGANMANRLTSMNDDSMSRKALIGNMENFLTKFEPGKGADWSLFAKNFANRNLPIPKSMQEPGGLFDLKSVASQEEFNKLATTLIQAQFSAIGGTGTDAKFSSAYDANPNELMSRMGIEGVARLMKGNEDAIQAKNAAWNKWRKVNGPDTYADFSQDFNDKFDPRAFQFKYLTKAERTDYLKGMEPEERDRFMHDLTHARIQKWIKF